MAFELIYTSVPKGIKPGSSGFCTVAYTNGLAGNVVLKLEGMSAYKPYFPHYDANAEKNPVSFSHYVCTISGEELHFVSRTGFYGLDYTKRSNKLAHHCVLKSSEAAALSAGPAALCQHSGTFVTEWNTPPQLLPQQKRFSLPELTPGKAAAWGAAAGDAGWAGTLAQYYLDNPSKPVYIIFDPLKHTNMLALAFEAMMMLPPEKRWGVSFNTYFMSLPAGMSCNWRFCTPDADVLKEARRVPGTLIIDLTTALPPAGNGELENAARTGIMPRKEAPVAPQQQPQQQAPRPSLAQVPGNVPIQPRPGVNVSGRRLPQRQAPDFGKKKSMLPFIIPIIILVLLVLGGGIWWVVNESGALEQEWQNGGSGDGAGAVSPGAPQPEYAHNGFSAGGGGQKKPASSGSSSKKTAAPKKAEDPLKKAALAAADKAKKAAEKAKKDADAALTAAEKAESHLSSANLTEAQTALANAQKAKKSAEAALKKAEAALKKVKGGCPDAQARIDAAQETLNNATANINEATAKKDAAAKALKAKKDAAAKALREKKDAAAREIHRKGLYSFAGQLANLKKKGGRAEFPNFLAPGEKITHLTVSYVESNITKTQDVPVADNAVTLETVSLSMATSVYLKFKITYEKGNVVFTEANPSFKAKNIFTIHGLKTSKGETLYFRFNPEYSVWPKAKKSEDPILLGVTEGLSEVKLLYSFTDFDEISGIKNFFEKGTVEVCLRAPEKVFKALTRNGERYEAGYKFKRLADAKRSKSVLELLKKHLGEKQIVDKKNDIRKILDPKASRERLVDEVNKKYVKPKKNKDGNMDPAPWDWNKVKDLYRKIQKKEKDLGDDFKKLRKADQKKIIEFLNKEGLKLKFIIIFEEDKPFEEYPLCYLINDKCRAVTGILGVKDKEWLKKEKISLKELLDKTLKECKGEEKKYKDFMNTTDTHLYYKHNGKRILLKRVRVQKL